MFSGITNWLRNLFRDACLEGVRDAVGVIQGRVSVNESEVAKQLALDVGMGPVGPIRPATPTQALPGPLEGPEPEVKRGRGKPTAASAAA